MRRSIELRNTGSDLEREVRLTIRSAYRWVNDGSSTHHLERDASHQCIVTDLLRRFSDTNNRPLEFNLTVKNIRRRGAGDGHFKMVWKDRHPLDQLLYQNPTDIVTPFTTCFMAWCSTSFIMRGRLRC